MSTATYEVFRNLLKSVGFSESTIPANPTPDFMLGTLSSIESISPVALTEVAAMRKLIETLKAEKFTENKDMGTQYSPRDTGKVPKMKPAPIITTVRHEYRSTNYSPSPNPFGSPTQRETIP